MPNDDLRFRSVVVKPKPNPLMSAFSTAMSTALRQNVQKSPTLKLKSGAMGMLGSHFSQKLKINLSGMKKKEGYSPCATPLKPRKLTKAQEEEEDRLDLLRELQDENQVQKKIKARYLARQRKERAEHQAFNRVKTKLPTTL